MRGLTLQSFYKPHRLSSSHIPLRITFFEGMGILRSLERQIVENWVGDHSYFVDCSIYRLAIYVTEGKVTSTWYDDPAGRISWGGKEEKIKLYLSRYGQLQNWEMRLDNGWMLYWFNPIDHVSMVYGLHKDVIRFNIYDHE